MQPSVHDLIDILERIAPKHLAEEWDNVGLLVGSADRPVTRVLLALDPSIALVEEAVTRNADLVITHHPVIFRPLKALRTDQHPGRLLHLALRNDLAFFACHTNLDATHQGVNDVLALRLGLRDCKPLVPAACAAEESCGLGRIGQYQQPLHADQFLARLASALQPPWLLEAGLRPTTVRRVAVCGGSCSDFSSLALASHADVFVTAEIKHDKARWAEDVGLWLVDGGHFATENLAMASLRDQLKQHLDAAGFIVEILLAEQQPPLKLAYDQSQYTDMPTDH